MRLDTRVFVLPSLRRILAGMTTEFSRPHWTPPILRWLLLALVLTAFGRVMWQLDAKNFWWDESLSLQRAEQAWWPLLRGELVLKDGYSELMTIDQHPFFSFLLQGLLLRMAGSSEFVLRFPAAAAATLLTPLLWALARRLAILDAVPPGTASWAALLAAVNPFYLWYGQEARPYSLWAMLAVLSTYLLLRALTFVAANQRTQRLTLAGYAVSLAAFLSTHYLAVFLIPLHGLLVFWRLAQRNLRRALTWASILAVIGGAAALVAMWQLLRPGAGDNLNRITLSVLAPDLLNAFSMGLSVNINDVWRLDLLFGALALLGTFWALRTQKRALAGGWIAPLFVLIPIAILLVINGFRPAYMNARHLSLISGGFVLLVAAGLAVLAQWRGWFAAAIALTLVAGNGYSTHNYFTLDQYAKDDYAGLGVYLDANLLPGDLALLSPPSSWRVFDYYLPLDKIMRAEQAGKNVAVYGTPLLNRDWVDTEAQLAAYLDHYPRIWLARSGTHPFFDPQGRVSDFLLEHAARQLEVTKFRSYDSFLDLELYLSKPPVIESMTPPAQHRLAANFGEQLKLAGYDIGQPLLPGQAIPITLYWQVTTKPEVHYKYILQLVATTAAGEQRVVAQVDEEPFKGSIPTVFWDPGKTLLAYTALPPVELAANSSVRYELALQVYRADTLAKEAPQLEAGEATVAAPETLLLPFVVPTAP